MTRGAATPPGEPRLALSAAFFGNPSGNELAPWLGEVATAGYAGVALFADFWIWGDGIGDGVAVARRLADAGLGVASLVTRVDDDVERFRRLADSAARIGCRHLVTIGGEGHGERSLARLAAQLETVGRIVGQAGVRASYHHHTDTTGESLADVVALLARTDPELVGLTFDAGHATKDFTELAVDRRALDALERLWPRIALVELKDWSTETDLDTPVGDGMARGGELVEALRARGYADWLVVEQNDDTGRTLDDKWGCVIRSRELIEARLREERDARRATVA